MKFDENDIEVSSLVLPLELNQILINLKIKETVKFQVLIDSTRKEIWIDRHEDADEIFKGYTVRDGIITL